MWVIYLEAGVALALLLLHRLVDLAEEEVARTGSVQHARY